LPANAAMRWGGARPLSTTAQAALPYIHNNALICKTKYLNPQPSTLNLPANAAMRWRPLSTTAAAEAAVPDAYSKAQSTTAFR